MHGYKLPRTDVDGQPSVAFGQGLNFGLGCKWGFMPTTDGSVVGPGTSHPVAFTKHELVRIFYKVKTALVTGTIPGGTDNTATLQYPSGDPWALPRARLMVDAYALRTLPGGAKYFFTILPIGFIFDGGIYPLLRGSFNPAAEPTTEGSGPIVGALNFFGKSVPLFSGGAVGDMTVTPDTFWP